MKQLIYILILLPSLLFSQETKNMELVGVRNISVDNTNPTINFQVNEGVILKVLSFTHSKATTTNSEWTPWLKLNNEFLYYGYSLGILKSDFPLYLSEGTHQLEINTLNNYSFSATLYALEFKLTTP